MSKLEMITTKDKKLPQLDLYTEVAHVQLQTPINLPNYFSTTQTLNKEKLPGIKMYVHDDWLIIVFKDKIAMTPHANITSLILV